jgi:hypothetical protein
VSKNSFSGRDPALRGFCKCSHIMEYAALSKTPRALADGLILVFKHPDNLSWPQAVDFIRDQRPAAWRATYGA